MKLSARNILRGKVIKIERGAINSEVLMDLSGGSRIVSVITNTSVDDLGLKPGQEAHAVIKASNVMIAVE